MANPPQAVHRFRLRDIVEDRLGWQEYAVGSGPNLRKIDASLAPISTANGVLGMPGMTAYFGLFDVGQPKAGETVVVVGSDYNFDAGYPRPVEFVDSIPALTKREREIAGPQRAQTVIGARVSRQGHGRRPASALRRERPDPAD